MNILVIWYEIGGGDVFPHIDAYAYIYIYWQTLDFKHILVKIRIVFSHPEYDVKVDTHGLF